MRASEFACAGYWKENKVRFPDKWPEILPARRGRFQRFSLDEEAAEVIPCNPLEQRSCPPSKPYIDIAFWGKSLEQSVSRLAITTQGHCRRKGNGG